jgi:hypothetical protein
LVTDGTVVQLCRIRGELLPVMAAESPSFSKSRHAVLEAVPSKGLFGRVGQFLASFESVRLIARVPGVYSLAAVRSSQALLSRFFVFVDPGMDVLASFADGTALLASACLSEYTPGRRRAFTVPARAVAAGAGGGAGGGADGAGGGAGGGENRKYSAEEKSNWRRRRQRVRRSFVSADVLQAEKRLTVKRASSLKEALDHAEKLHAVRLWVSLGECVV